MSKQTKLITVLSLILVTPAMRAGTQQVTQAPSQTRTDSASVKPATQDPNYLIGAQDVLDISVWKEAELTRSVPVRPDGKISMPLLNDVQAEGLTPLQLSSDITTKLKKYIADPQVTIVVTQVNSQRIFILGEVNRAGAYPLLPGMRMLEALSSAGGFTIFANTKKIYLLRKTESGQEKYPFHYKDVIAGKSSEENIELKAGDTIVVP